ncbi:MAG: hypothetical protein U0487_01505 [Patescibacteria group bacterium]
MRKNAPTDRLEDLHVTIDEDRLITLLPTGDMTMGTFVVFARYGQEPGFFRATGAIMCSGLELIFMRKPGKREIVLPITFARPLIIEFKDLGDLSALKYLHPDHPNSHKTLLFGILEAFTKKASVHVQACGSKLVVHVSYLQQASDVCYLNELQTSYLLNRS